MISNNRMKFIRLAATVASQSDSPDFKHGAVLVKSGSVINTNSNRLSFCSFGARFRDYHSGTPTLHAELGCVLNIPNSSTSGGIIYVVRVNKVGQMKNSKPCAMCEAAMRFVGIKRVFYSSSDGIRSMKLN